MNQNTEGFLQAEVVESDEIIDIHSVLDEYEGVLKIRRDLGMTNEIRIYIQGQEHKVLKSDEMNYYVVAEAGNYEVSLIGAFGVVTRIVQVKALKMTEVILKQKRGPGVPTVLYAIALNLTVLYPFLTLVVHRRSFLFRNDLFVTCLLLVAICYYLKKRYGRYYADVVEQVATVNVVNKAGYLNIDSIEANKDFVAFSENECGVVEFNQPKQWFGKHENVDILVKRRGVRHKQYDQKYSQGTGWSRLLLTTMPKDTTEGAAFYFQTGRYVISLANKEIELFVNPLCFYEVELKLTKIYRILNFIFKTSMFVCLAYLFSVFVYHYPRRFEWGTFSIFIGVVIAMFVIRELGEKYKLSVHEYARTAESYDYVFGLPNNDGGVFLKNTNNAYVENEDDFTEEGVEKMEVEEMYDDMEEEMAPIANHIDEEVLVESPPIAGVLNIYRPFSFLDQETMSVAIQGEGTGAREYRKEYRYILEEGTYDVTLCLNGVINETIQISDLKATEITVKLSAVGKILQFIMKTSIWLFVLSAILLIVSFFFPLPLSVLPHVSGVLLIVFFVSLQFRTKMNHYQVDVSQRSTQQRDYEQAEVIQCRPTKKALKVVYSPVLYENTIWNLYKKQVQLLDRNSFGQVVRGVVISFLVIITLGVGTYFFQEKMMVVNLLIGILLLTFYDYGWKMSIQISLGLALFVLTLLPSPFSLLSVIGMALYLFPCVIGLRDNFIFSKIGKGHEVSEKIENKYANIIKNSRDIKHKNYTDMYIDNQCIRIVSKKGNTNLYFSDLVNMIEIENACLLRFSKGYYFQNNTRLVGSAVTSPYTILNMQDTFMDADVPMQNIVAYMKRYLEENK